MPLRVLDGNQTATTLSSVVTGGEHIVAHSVVCFGSTAIANITNAISGSVVSISNFPSTQTIAGTVTANANVVSIPLSAFPDTWITAGDTLKVDINTIDTVSPAAWLQQSGGDVPISGTVTARGNLIGIGQEGTGFLLLALDDAGIQNPVLTNGDGHLLVSVQSGAVTASLSSANLNSVTIGVRGTVTVGNSVTIGSLPPISGTVTARLQDASGNNLTSTSIGGVQRLNVSLASAATPGGSLPSFVNVYGGSDGSAVRTIAVDSSGRTVVTVANFPATQAVSLASTTVTVSNVAGFNIPTHDFKSFSYTSGNLTGITYRTGGSGGTVVGTITLAYDGSGNLTSMTRT